MLHKSAVSVNLLQVLEKMQDKTTELGFALAGGTSLALRFNHRISIDLDFFTENDSKSEEWPKLLGVGHETITGIADGTLQIVTNGIKVEFLRHAYPKLAEHDTLEKVRMWSLQDVSAMKLNAIANRGSKKDFYDIATLLEQFSLESMIGHYQAKYRPASLLMLIRSLAWFDDADAEPDPITLRGETWSGIKEKISSAIRTLK